MKKVYWGEGRWQIVWWWRWPTLPHYWEYPDGWRKRPVFKQPIFKGLDIGIFEIRYFPPINRRNEVKNGKGR